MLGGASPARSFLLQDDDGISRVYPQALLKEMNATQHHEFGPFDIMALFNAEFDWWFVEDQTPIANYQYDFLYVILHEMVHGLGFLSSWADYNNESSPKALYPNPLPPEEWDTGVSKFNFTGFYENAFDRYLVSLPDLKPLRNLTKQLDAFDGNITGKGRMYDSLDQFYQKFQASNAYKLSQQLLDTSTQQNRIAFMPRGVNNDEGAILLETALKPFALGSSITHVDEVMYSDTSDFLMRWETTPGQALGDRLHEENWVGGPLGPNLLKVLETLGYKVKRNPTRVTIQGSPTSTASRNVMMERQNVVVLLLFQLWWCT